MVCLNPKPVKFSWYTKVDEKTGEVFQTKKLKFRRWDEELNEDTDWIPCGKCEGCRVDKANDNATKAFLEAQNWPQNAFLTLTYDNDHLPKFRSLSKRDLQLFWKRLRKTLPKNQKIKYLACGEYGPVTLRPHYHAAVFNFWPADAKIYKCNELGDRLYTSETLNKIWQNGYVILGNLTYQSAAYIARYVYKKAYGAEKQNLKLNKEPEFTTCSKRPGLARNFFEDPEKWDLLLRNQGVLIPTPKGLKLKKIPQYLKKLWKKYDHENYFFMQEKNKNKIKQNQKNILILTSKNFGYYKKQNDDLKLQKLKRLDKFRNNL